MPDTHRAKPDVKIGEPHPEQAHPGPEHVASIEAAHAAVGLLTERRFREPVDAAADQMPERVTAEGVAAEEYDIEGQNDRPDADTEGDFGRYKVNKPDGLPDIVGQEGQENERQIQKVTVDVLND